MQDNRFLLKDGSSQHGEYEMYLSPTMYGQPKIKMKYVESIGNPTELLDIVPYDSYENPEGTNVGFGEIKSAVENDKASNFAVLYNGGRKDIKSALESVGFVPIKRSEVQIGNL